MLIALPLLPLVGGLLGIVAALRSRPRDAAIIGIVVMVSAAGLAVAQLLGLVPDAAPGRAGVTIVTILLAMAFHIVDLPRRWNMPAGSAALSHASVDLLGSGLLLMVSSASTAAAIAGGQLVIVSAYLLGGRCFARTRGGAMLSSAATGVAGAVWRFGDLALIDGTVDAVAGVVRGWSGILKRAQTGAVRVYVVSAMAGAVLIFGFYLWSR